MRVMIGVLYLFVLVVGVAFAVLNATPIQINFYIVTLTMPVSLLVASVLAIGIMIGYSLHAWRYWRLRSETRRLKNQLKVSEKEIKNLRAIPLRDQH